jgi:hypothetical protein
LLEITKVDIASERISGVFTATFEDSIKTKHVIEGSFTDIYLKNGIAGGEYVSMDVSGNGIHSAFSSSDYFDGFGNTKAQGVKGSEYFAIITHSDESQADGYESLSMYLKKPIHSGSYDLEPNSVYYSKYRFDNTTGLYVLYSADTNVVSIPNALTVTDYDAARQRVSGTFNFSIVNSSPRSPIQIRNGRFKDIFWW